MAPATVLANEVGATFGEAHTRRVQIDDYRTWSWTLHLAFNEQVILHEFHYGMLENFVLIPSGAAAGVRQATARMVSAQQIQHPAVKQSPSGTKVIYTLDVRLRPA